MNRRLLMSVLSTLLLVVALPGPVATAAPATVSGSVAAGGTRWRAHQVRITEPSTISARMSWDTAAELTLTLKDAAGATVARGARTAARTVTLEHRLTATGTYRLAVWARRGSARYTITYDVVQQAGSGGSAGRVRYWAAANEGAVPAVTAAKAQQDARHFDVIVAQPRTYRDHVGVMKRTNTDLTILAYVNALFAPPHESNTHPADWYARDRRGRKITSTAFGNYLMNPLNTAWINTRKQECRRVLASSGYDGCMLDMLTFAPLYPGYASGIPVDPRTGKEWTRQRWLAATRGVAQGVRAAVSPAVIVGNGVGSGHLYSDPTSPTSTILEGTDGVVAESWLRTATQPIDVFRPEHQWKAAVDALRDADARDKTMHVYVKVWSQATAAQRNAWHEYALATFLLGSAQRSFFTFSGAKHQDPTAPPRWAELDLGSARGRYLHSGGVYQRDFGRGKVLVNPTSQGRRVALDRTYVDRRGNRVTSIWLGANSGKILTTT